MIQPVACQTCGNRLEVEKHTYHHTSIQWTQPAEQACPELTEYVATGHLAGRLKRCTALMESIRQAVVSGEFVIPDPDDEEPETD